MSSKTYFPNLNGIRFILAGMVLLQHVAVVLQVMQISNIYQKVDAFKAFGPVAVSMFFALSGFLITFLLLQENKATDTISLRTFYLSRAKRIMPLYYLIVILHLWVLPHTPLQYIDDKLVLMDASAFPYSTIHLSDFSTKIWYFILLPQVALALMVATGNSTIPAGHVWSIGVEEIFYFLYPALLKKYVHKFKRLIFTLIGIYYSAAILLFIVIQFSHTEILAKPIFQRAINFSVILIIYNRVNCMFIGAIGAYLFIHKHRYFYWLTQKWVFYFSLVLLFVLFAIGARVPFLTYELYCVLFICVLFYLIKDNKAYFLENSILRYLGQISYGIYMYQMLAIYGVVYLYMHLHFHYLYIFPLSFVLTILLSAVSYEYLEKRIKNSNVSGKSVNS
ncbi:MAG: acyltransferase [Chitinophagales bacterium]|nr:acyltransferase [Chitinophagales bacterium]